MRLAPRMLITARLPITRSSSRLTVVGLVTGLVMSVLLASPARAASPHAPGGFTGHGFDTCVAPDQATMDTWNLTSPFSAVGIYISGGSRYCGDADQPNLSPQWVAQNARNGWRFLPIHVGRQAPCFANNPQSGVQKAKMSRSARTARSEARSEAKETIAALKKYGFGKRSVSYLDIEWYSRTASCDRIVLEFIDAWTEYLHARGYKSGLYASGSAAIAAVDDARRAGRRGFNRPDHVWIAWGNGRANTDGGPYLSDSGWKRQRLHQYQLDVKVTYGGASVHIDKNFLDVNKGSVASKPSKPCGVTQTFKRYPTLKVGSKGTQVKALECMLRRQGFLPKVDQHYGIGTARAIDAFRATKGWAPTGTAGRATWTALLSAGRNPRVLKQGSVGPSVWRLQRSLVAAGASLRITGVYDSRTVKAVQAYRRAHGLPGYSTAEATVWAELQRGQTV
jgi:peptidoglycan hydrolase-like protein with peptidoglycan-binding domain